jgi:acyl-CoA synthetase (AMP-forming)/AMP-acid ligase II
MTPKPELVASVKAGEGLETLGPDSDSIVFFTSGTTSLPKGVLVTQHQALHIIHSSTYQNARTTLRLGASVEEALKAYDPKPEGVAMLSIPLFHVQGTLTWLMVALHNGSKLVFLRHWSVPTAVKLMVEHKVGRIGGVPAIPAAILTSPDLPADFELASTTYGGATPPSDLAQRLVKRWPKMLPGTGWGMTETSAFHTGFNGQEYLAKPHGAGQALPVTEIKVVDPTTRKDLPRGEVGLLLARGQNLMKEYVNNPSEYRPGGRLEPR